MRQRPTPEQLRDLFSLDCETGVLTWKSRAPRRKKVGDEAGGPHPDGYLQVHVPGYRAVMVHRLVWVIVHGVWPTQEIDHRDLDKRNNRPGNLRDCTHQVNVQNQYEATCASHTGYRGVRRLPNGRFASTIKDAAGHPVYLGTFNTPGAAHLRYLSAKREMHAGCTR